MRAREDIREEFDAHERNGVLDAGGPQLVLEVLLDIRDILLKQSREVVVDFVPPDYGRKDKLV